MSDDYTYFDLPNSPDQIGVLLAPPNLRSIDFSALDYDAARRSILEYIQTYYPNDFNDFVASNGMMMLTEIQASNVAKLSLRSDLIANESFLSTATTEEAVINHLALINQKIKRQTPAVVDIEISVNTPSSTDIRIPAGLVFQTRGPNDSVVYYEVYRAPNDFTSDIVVQAGKRGVIGYGIEGRFSSDIKLVSTGGAGQSFTINDSQILDEPFYVFVDGTEEDNKWTVTRDPLELFGPNDRIVSVQMYGDRAELLFGDNVNGRAPLSGQEITVRYRKGGGVRGRISTLAINESRSVSPAPPASSPVSVLFRNLMPSSGGTDKETLEQAKRRAPRDFGTRSFSSDRPLSIITESDYAQVATTFSHPVFGSVAKAVATVRTSLNSNTVELYVLANGANGLVTPSAGLKTALANYIDRFNAVTDQTKVLDGSILYVDVEMTIAIHKNADATFVKTQVESLLDGFFSTTNREMGQPLFVSDLYDLLSAVHGISYIDIFKPSKNILKTESFSDDFAVSINEIILEGTRDVKVYYEKGSF